MTSTFMMEKMVVLGTGGTIAGTAPQMGDNLGYRAAQVGVAQLLQAVPGLSVALGARRLVTEQVAQIDSKDMSFAVWQSLALRVQHYLKQADVRGIIITHGTDTLEETAYFLHAVLPSALVADKAVVLTCAMRPASSAAPDGPQNLLDAVALLRSEGACGVLVVCAGTVHRALMVQKVHPYRLDAFSSGDAGPLAYVEEGVVRLVQNWHFDDVFIDSSAIENIANITQWPRIEIVMNYVGASGALVDALLNASVPLAGLVVAATGNGTLHHELEAALMRAQAAGVSVLLSTRCANGCVLTTPSQQFSHSAGLSPVKARVALMLRLLPAPGERVS